MSLDEVESGFQVVLGARNGAMENLEVDAVVNCTRPASASSYETGSMLVDRLLQSGVAKIDTRRLGLDVDASGDLIGASGAADPRLHAIG